MITLADRLKELRKDKGLTQKDLGDILGVGKTTISMYENGNSTPNDEIKLKICDYFDISLDYLIGKSSIKNYSHNPYFEDVNKIAKHNGIHTLAAHFENEEFTQDDLDDIENFINYVISKKKNK